MSCPPGHLCIKHFNVTIIMIITLVIFIFYVLQRPESDFIKLSNNSNSTAIVPYNDEESELRKEKLRQEIQKIKEEGQVSTQSHRSYLRDKALERTVNPLLPPERSYENTYGVPINIPTRGPEGGMQQVGYLYKDEITDDNKKIGNNSESIILPLYGAPTFHGSNKWTYYISSDKFHSIKMPIEHKSRECNSEYGCDEIYDNDVVEVPSYNGNFKVKIYDYDKPRYIPYIF